MRPTEVAECLEKLMPTRQPIYLWGPPGGGKSALVKQAAKRAGMQLIDLRVSLLDPVDLMGLPTVKDGRTVWATPDVLPRSGRGVLFLDELAQGAPLIQGSLLSLTFGGEIGTYRLPEEWTVVAASNRQEDRAGTHRIITPLLNRFLHLDLEVSNDDWQEWAAQAGVVPAVRACLRFKPGLLFQFEPSSNPRAFPTPRSWEFVSNILPVTPPRLLHQVVAGCIGEGPAAELCAFLRVYENLPDIDKILEEPQTASVPKGQLDVLHAVVVALVERVRSAGPDAKAVAQLLTNFAVYGQRLPDEFGALALRDAVALRPQQMYKVKATGDWIRKLRTKGVFDFPSSSAAAS